MEQKKKQQSVSADKTVWEDVILPSLFRIYLLGIAVEFGKVCLYTPTPERSLGEYAVNYFLLPVIGEGILILLLRFVILYGKDKWNKLALDIICIVTGNFYAMVTVFMHARVSFVGMVYMIPLAVVAVYREKCLIYAQFGITIFLYAWSRIWLLPKLSYLPAGTVLRDTVVYTAMVIAFTIIQEQVRLSYVRQDVRSCKDSLTQLYNHEAFYEELEKWMKDFEETHEPFSILIADIDNFKRVNDTYGHAFGDEVIRLVAEVMGNNRGTKGFIARYGGEEFAMIFPRKGVSETITIADKIRREFAERKLETEDGEKSFTISIGVAEYNRPYRTSSSFFEEADRALYEAKKGGKNKVCCHRDGAD